MDLPRTLALVTYGSVCTNHEEHEDREYVSSSWVTIFAFRYNARTLQGMMARL